MSVAKVTIEIGDANENGRVDARVSAVVGGVPLPTAVIDLPVDTAHVTAVGLYRLAVGVLRGGLVGWVRRWFGL